jgi:5'-nucleotidase
MNKRKIIYIDMDGVVADYLANVGDRHPDLVCDIPGYFLDLPVIDFSREAFNFLNRHFDVYFLSTPVWDNPSSYTEKRIWIGNTFGEAAEKKLILSHNKGLFYGHYLIDDRRVNGVEEFAGEHIHFGTPPFSGWESVLTYIALQEKLWAEYKEFLSGADNIQDVPAEDAAEDASLDTWNPEWIEFTRLIYRRRTGHSFPLAVSEPERYTTLYGNGTAGVTTGPVLHGMEDAAPVRSETPYLDKLGVRCDNFSELVSTRTEVGLSSEDLDLTLAAVALLDMHLNVMSFNDGALKHALVEDIKKWLAAGYSVFDIINKAEQKYLY